MKERSSSLPIFISTPFFANDPRLIEELISQPVEKWQSIFESVSANQTVSPGGTDTNYPLLTSALDAAEKSDVKYDYALITGDFLAHNFPEKYRRFSSGWQWLSSFRNQDDGVC